MYGSLGILTQTKAKSNDTRILKALKIFGNWRNHKIQKTGLVAPLPRHQRKQWSEHTAHRMRENL
jgi:hypothetical protein